MRKDETGESPIAVGALIAKGLLGLLGLAAITSAVLAPPAITSPNLSDELQERWQQGVAISAFAWLMLKSRIKSKSEAKADTDSQKQPRYWAAELVNVDGKRRIAMGQSLTYAEALVRVRAGGSIVCVNKRAAHGIAKFFPGAIEHIETNGRLSHYHLTKVAKGKRINEKGKIVYTHDVHIWYYGQ